MSGRWIRTLLLSVAAGAAIWAVARFALREDREWSAGSPAALAAFEEGLEARLRLYEADAAAAFRRALELDPEFAAAKVQLASVTRLAEERQRLFEELGAIDLSRLTQRERFLVEIALAAKEPERQRQLVDRAYAEHPEDPWVLFVAAGQAWDREDWSEAERLFGELLSVDPNWVMAHNHLGYLAMSQARFERSEEHFRTYAFVAPDQANPHDSLGELLALRGRYSEAREEIELALAEKPDFCASYINLIGLSIFQARTDDFEPVIARMRANCPEPLARDVECEVALIEALLESDFERPWRDGSVECAIEDGRGGPVVHRLALLAGRDEIARAEEERLRGALADLPAGAAKGRARRLEFELRHAEGVRALLEGDAAAAVAKLRAADEHAVYWGAAEGRFKLFNLLHLAIACERANDARGAESALAAVRAVNPAYVELRDEIAAELDPAR